MSMRMWVGLAVVCAACANESNDGNVVPMGGAAAGTGVGGMGAGTAAAGTSSVGGMAAGMIAAAGTMAAAGAMAAAGTMATAGTTATAGTMAVAGAGGSASGLAPADYSLDANWMCRPGMTQDACAVPLTATEVHSDGTTTTFDLPPSAVDAPVDCFYVYPTVDLDMVAENKDFPAINREYILDPLLSQAAPLRDLCNLYAPVYRQATIGAYYDPSVTEEKLGIAFADVAAAFAHYLANFDTGKPLVIAGHSQGSMMSTLLIQSMIDADPVLRERLVAALLIGTLGFYSVPDGATVGSSFTNVPLCTSAEENGCVITFNTYADGYAPGATYGALGAASAAGVNVGCTNPAAVAGGKVALGASYFLTAPAVSSFASIPFDFGSGITTTFAVYRDFFAAECAPADNGNLYLKMYAEPAMGDTRTNPIPFADPSLSPSILGLHVLDYGFVLEDLRTLLTAKIAAH